MWPHPVGLGPFGGGGSRPVEELEQAGPWPAKQRCADEARAVNGASGCIQSSEAEEASALRAGRRRGASGSGGAW